MPANFTGSLAISGSLVLTGSISATGTITISGSILSASYASNAELLDNLDSTSFVYTSSFNTYSSSISTRVTNLESTASVLTTASASFAVVSSSFATTSGSLSTRVTTIEGSYATTGSNIFVGTQGINNSSNAISFTSTASLYVDGGARITRDLYVSGTSYFNNVTIYGTQSVNYITSSQLNIGTNIITVNTDTPTVRYGGLAVYDSGSTGLTGSILWDSENNHWIYTNPSASTYSGGMLISGPRASARGCEVGTTACSMMMGQGGDHITSSAIFHYGNATCFYGNSYISSSGISCFAGTVCAPTFVGGGGDFRVHSNGSVSIGNPTQIGTLYIAGDTTIQTNADIGSNGGYMTLQKNGGNIGVGVTTPYSNLHVLGTIKVATGNAQGILGLGEANGATVNVGLWRGAANAPTSDGNYLNLGGYEGIIFAVGSAAIGSQTERMRITSGGDVGIGVSSPIYGKLHVGAATTDTVNYYGSSRVLIQQTCNLANNFANLSFVSQGGSDSAAIWSQIIAHGNGATCGTLSFGTSNSSGAATERMRITSTGEACFSSTVCALNIISSGAICSSGDGKNLDIGGVAVIRGNGGACTTHYFTTGAANVAKYLQYNATGIAINVIAADNHTYFNSGCNVGIGTTSPNTKLTVVGNDSSNPNVVLRLSSTAYTGVPYPNASLRFGSAYDSYPTWNLASIDASYTGNSWGGSLLFFTNNDSLTTNLTERMRITSGGNVLINCNRSEYGQLQVSTLPTTANTYASALGLGFLANACEGASTGISFYTKISLGSGIWENARISTITEAVTSSAYGALAFYTMNATVLCERMRISSNGNISIGSISPNAKLEVYPGSISSNACQEVIRLDVPGSDIFSSAMGYINFRGYDVSNNVQRDVAWIGAELIADLAASCRFGGNLVFRTTNSGLSQTPQERMRISSAGNIGISTSTPCEKLDVNGTILAGCSADGSGYKLRGTDGTVFRFADPTTAGGGTTNVNLGAVGASCGDIRFHATNTLFLSNGGTNERMRVTSAGLIGINTTSPVAPLQVVCTPGSFYGIIETTACTAGTAKHFRVHKPNCVEYGIGILDNNSFHISTASTFPTTNGFTLTSAGIACFGCRVCAPAATISTYLNAQQVNGDGVRTFFNAYCVSQAVPNLGANNGIIVVRDHVVGGTGAWILDPNIGVISLGSNITNNVSFTYSGCWQWCITCGSLNRCLSYGFYGA
jgi:hypothetical protein